jgi:hypothetical protein
LKAAHNGDGRIGGTDAVVFDFPYGMQYLAMKVKNAADDTLLLRSDLEVGDLTTGTLSGLITSSSGVVVSSANIKVNLVLEVTNGGTTSTVTLAATVTSGGTWCQLQRHYRTIPGHGCKPDRRRLVQPGGMVQT